MSGGMLGGGVIFVVAAVLWAAVLVPAWMRRREFRAAERNALRLQRTLRILAETSEIPQEVRLEATAKQALAQEKILRTARKAQDAEREAELADARAAQLRAEIRAQQKQRKANAVARSSKLRTPVVRRVRATAALGALIGLVGVLIGAGVLLSGAGVAVLAWSGLVAATSVGALVLLAPGRVKVKEIPAERVVESAVFDQVEDAVSATDQAVPSASEQAAQHRAAQAAAAERIERARALARSRAEKKPTARENQPDSMLLQERAAQAERGAPAERGAVAGQSAPTERRAPSERSASTERGATSEPTTRGDRAATARSVSQAEVGARQSAAAKSASERLRKMGVVGDTSEGMPNLDDVLRRRRNAG